MSEGIGGDDGGVVVADEVVFDRGKKGAGDGKEEENRERSGIFESSEVGARLPVIVSIQIWSAQLVIIVIYANFHDLCHAFSIGYGVRARFLLGRAGSGKTHTCVAEVRRALKR